MAKLKMVIVMRNDLNMRKGKMIAQGAHAATMCLLQNTDDPTLILNLVEWVQDSHMMKVCVRVDNEAELLDIASKAKDAGLTCHVITDAGFTEFAGVPTRTCLAIGPNSAELVDVVTGGLKLL